MKRIKVQSHVKEDSYNFIKELSEKNNVSISKTIENIIIEKKNKSK